MLAVDLEKLGNNLNAYLRVYKDSKTTKAAVGVYQVEQVIDNNGKLTPANQPRLFVVNERLQGRLPALPQRHKKFRHDPETDRLRPLFLQATGLDINFSGSSELGTMRCIASDCYADLNSLVDSQDPLREEQVKLYRSLHSIQQHAHRVWDWEIGHSQFARHKGQQLVDLVDKLKAITRDFFNEYQRSQQSPRHLVDMTNVYQDFRQRFDKELARASYLDDHRGYQRALCHLSLCLVLIGFVTGALDYYCKYAPWGSGQYYFFNDTHSRQLVNQTQENIEQFSQYFAINGH